MKPSQRKRKEHRAAARVAYSIGGELALCRFIVETQRPVQCPERVEHDRWSAQYVCKICLGVGAIPVKRAKTILEQILENTR